MKTYKQICAHFGCQLTVDQGHDGWRCAEHRIVSHKLVGTMVGGKPFPAPNLGRKESKPEAYDLIPWDAMDEVARVYRYGAEKYGDPHQWRNGYAWSLNLAAMIRHATKFWMGEDRDPDSGLHHMAHAVFHALALIVNTTAHPEHDDRPGRNRDATTEE